MPTPNRDILAIGTSAGGVDALIFLAKSLPPDLPASILVTIRDNSASYEVQKWGLLGP